MLNIGNLIIESLDYIFIVDKDYNIIYNSRFDRHFSDKSGESPWADMVNRNFFEVYPDLDRENSNIVRSMETQSIVVNKKQRYWDYMGREYFTNNVTIPLRRKGELAAVVELASDAKEGGTDSTEDDRRFEEFVSHLQERSVADHV